MRQKMRAAAGGVVVVEIRLTAEEARRGTRVVVDVGGVGECEEGAGCKLSPLDWGMCVEGVSRRFTLWAAGYGGKDCRVARSAARWFERWVSEGEGQRDWGRRFPTYASPEGEGAGRKLSPLDWGRRFPTYASLEGEACVGWKPTPPVTLPGGEACVGWKPTPPVTLPGGEASRRLGSLRPQGVLTAAACRSWRDYLYAHLHGGTPGNYFKKLRAFLDVEVECGRVAANVARGVALTFGGYRAKRELTEEEWVRVVGGCEWVRRRWDVGVAFAFACATGLRWCDVRRLRWEDVDVSAGVMDVTQQKVSGHSRRARLCVPLCATAVALLRCQRGSAGLVFRLPSYAMMRRVLGEWLGEIGVGAGVTFHSARHTFISRLVARGVDLRTVADLAGHSTTRHTERYVHSDTRHLREAVARIDG